MEGTRTARIAHASYENVAVVCPWCQRECIFNRRSDLGTLEPIVGREVSCLHPECDKRFWITGDRANSAHEMLIFDCYELLGRKHYMSCVLSIAQAYEMFFSLFFRVELVYRPYAAERGHCIENLNRVHQMLLDTMKPHSFDRMRRLFLRYLVDGHSPTNLSEAEAIVLELRPPKETPSDSDISTLNDADLVPLLLRVRRTTIGDLRNAVVHKDGYRPSASEAECCIGEARESLFPLTYRLDLHDDVNHYTMRLDGV
jgi:hypothetical protein